MTVNTLGPHHESRPTPTFAEWLWPFVPMGLSVFSGSALVYYHLNRNVIDAHSPLQRLFAWLYGTFGFAPSVMFFGLTILWSTIWFAGGRIERPATRFLRLFAMAVMLGVFLNLGDGTVSPEPHKGALGAWLAETLVAIFGYWLSLLLVWAVTFASLLLATDFFFYESFERMRGTAAPAPDAGVEAAVTDHLRGLAQATPAVATATATAPSFAPLARPVAMPDPFADAPEAGAPAAADAADTTPRRRTYAERKAERVARQWRQPTEDEWVPAAPESQEIDNPETRAAHAAPVVQPDDDIVELPPLEDEADASVEAEPVAAEAAADEPRAAEPIVFADDLAAAVEPVVELPSAPPAEVFDEVAPAAEREPVADFAEPEPVVAIPRPEAAPVLEIPIEPESEPEPAARQQQLFAAEVDEALVQEAIEVVTRSQRASAVFLQRRLRIDYATASDVLRELIARGVVAGEGDAAPGRS